MDLRSNRLEPTVGCVLKIEFFWLEPTTPPLSRSTGIKGRVKVVVRKQSFVVEFASFPVVSRHAHFPHTRPRFFFENNVEPISTRFDFVPLGFA